MGNSEVGHLNLGAGAVVRQDLVRIDDAIADGDAAPRNEVLRGGVRRTPRACTCSGSSPTAACTPRSSHLRALIALGARARRRGSGRARVHRRPRHAAARGRGLPAPSSTRTAGARAWARSWAATGRWTATGAGSARSGPTTCSCTAARPTTPTAASRPSRRLRARRDRRVHRADARRRARPGSGPGDSVICFNFRPDRMREITRALAEPGFGEDDRGAARLGRVAAAPPVERYTTLTSYEEDWPYPVVFAPEHPATTLVGGARQARRAPAARRRDGEVPARDVLLQRRRGGAAARASGASWCPRRGTCPPTTTSRR